MSIKDNMKKHNKYLASYATKDDEAYRLVEETDDIRTPFFRDIDRIIYALSYTRYIPQLTRSASYFSALRTISETICGCT